MVFHVIHLHVPGPFCPQELLSFREQHAKESEQTGQVDETAKEKERKRRWLTGRVSQQDNPGIKRWLGLDW